MPPIPWAQVVALVVGGGVFGYAMRRWFWRERVSGEVAGTEEVQAFEQRFLSERERVRRRG